MPLGVRGSQLDYWVDRPDVEAQQCVKLTGTNKPITYTTLIMCGLGEVSFEHCVFASTRRFSANNPTTPVWAHPLVGCVCGVCGSETEPCPRCLWGWGDN